MSSVERQLRDLLAADAGVAAVLGAGPSLRVYPQAAPRQPIAPYAIYYRVSTNTAPSASLATAAARLAWVRITYEVWSESYLAAKDAADAIRAALDGAATATILACRWIDGRDLYEPDSQPKPLHRVGADFLVHVKL